MQLNLLYRVHLKTDKLWGLAWLSISFHTSIHVKSVAKHSVWLEGVSLSQDVKY